MFPFSLNNEEAADGRNSSGGFTSEKEYEKQRLRLVYYEPSQLSATHFDTTVNNTLCQSQVMEIFCSIYCHRHMMKGRRWMAYAVQRNKYVNNLTGFETSKC